MHDALGAHDALADRHIEGVDDQLGILDSVNGPPDTPAAAVIPNSAAVDLSFPRGMFRDVTNSDFIQA